MSIKEKKKKNVNCIRECHISKEDRSTGECFIAVSGRIFTVRVVSRDEEARFAYALTNKIYTRNFRVFGTKEQMEYII